MSLKVSRGVDFGNFTVPSSLESVRNSSFSSSLGLIADVLLMIECFASSFVRLWESALLLTDVILGVKVFGASN